MTSPWIQHALEYKHANGCSFKEALENASTTYRSGKKESHNLLTADVIHVGGFPYKKLDQVYVPIGIPFVKDKRTDLKRITIDNKSHAVSPYSYTNILYYSKNPKVFFLFDRKTGVLTHVSPNVIPDAAKARFGIRSGPPPIVRKKSVKKR